MSAAEMTANGQKIAAGASAQIDAAIGLVLDAQRLVAGIQREISLGGVMPEPGEKLDMNTFQLWHRLETIDDRLHDALSKLGN